MEDHFEELKALKELLESGAISKVEYDRIPDLKCCHNTDSDRHLVHTLFFWWFQKCACSGRSNKYLEPEG